MEHKNTSAQKHEEECITGDITIKFEEQDIPEDTTEQQVIESPERKNPQIDGTAQVHTNLPVQTPVQFSQWLNQCSNGPESMASNEKTFTCDCCSKIFRKKYALQRHLETHSNARMECSVCHRLLKTKKTLKLHMMLHEDTGKIFECSECGFMTKQKQSMTRHQIRMHSKIADYKCQLCPKTFKFNGDLKRHHEAKHVVDPCYCEICGKTYRNSHFLRKHRRISKTHRNAYSRVCYGAIRGNQNIECATSQNKGKVKRVFNCSKCKWRFSSWRLLNKHMQRHLLIFNCDICGAVFKYKASFLKHQESHKQSEQF
ncbi:zinc finger protein 17-like [Bombus affinis]|uniref:zinc finger protein 17-like n=1 Tax=Bombus affinis TaxID=309941 RepID=UPI0021B7837E|nr:zinc finger protein 17-like [Bombus affinis]